jgi:hypothetical protein
MRDIRSLGITPPPRRPPSGELTGAELTQSDRVNAARSASDQPGSAPPGSEQATSDHPDSDRAGSDGAGSDRAGRATALKIVASVAANVTVLTGLLFWFGLLYTQTFFEFFRVHPSLLDQSANDILARGVDGLFVPLAALAFAVLVVIGVLRYLRSRLAEPTWLAVLRVGTPLAWLIGLGLLVAAAIVVANPASYTGYPGLPGLGLAVGVLALLFAWRRTMVGADAGPATAATEWGVMFLLIVVGLFWSVSDYSLAVGTERAVAFARQLPGKPDLVLYSEKSLDIGAAGVRETRCANPDSAYRYRYTGLKLLLQSGGEYVLLPATWSVGNGTTIVLPRTDSVRLEFDTSTTPSAGCG